MVAPRRGERRERDNASMVRRPQRPPSVRAVHDGSKADLLALQRAIGNSSVRAFLASHRPAPFRSLLIQRLPTDEVEDFWAWLTQKLWKRLRASEGGLDAYYGYRNEIEAVYRHAWPQIEGDVSAFHEYIRSALLYDHAMLHVPDWHQQVIADYRPPRRDARGEVRRPLALKQRKKDEQNLFRGYSARRGVSDDQLTEQVIVAEAGRLSDVEMDALRRIIRRRLHEITNRTMGAQLGAGMAANQANELRWGLRYGRFETRGQGMGQWSEYQPAAAIPQQEQDEMRQRAAELDRRARKERGRVDPRRPMIEKLQHLDHRLDAAMARKMQSKE